MKKRIIQILTFCLPFVLLYGCYKDDVQDLYSRQYLTSVGLKELDEKAEAINKEIKDIRTLIEKLKLGEPTTKVEYNVVNGDTLGVYLYFGKTKVYVPFGKNGKDAPEIKIGEDDYWYINGKKTDKKAVGKDACTPKMGVAQDPDNTSDPKVYWQITWCDGTKEFILHEGKKVPARGEDGLPGVVSAIKEIKVVDNQVIIKPTKEGTPDIVIPLIPDVMFEIYPEKATGKNGATMAIAYDTENNVLTFDNPEEEIIIPFVKSDYLGKLAADLPKGWNIKVDYDTKKIHLSSPSIEDIPQANHHFSMLLSARKADGSTWSREVVVDLKKKMYLNYFFAHNPTSPIDRPNSVSNQISFDGVTGNYSHFCLYAVQDDATGELTNFQKIFNHNIEEIKEYTHKSPAITINKPELYVNKGITQVDFFFPSDILEVRNTSGQNGQAPDWNKMDYYILTYKEDAKVKKGSKNSKITLVPPISPRTYISYAVRNASNRSDLSTIRLMRLPATVRFFIKDIKGLLGLNTSTSTPDGSTTPSVAETFDISKLSFRFPSSVGVFTDQVYTIVKGIEAQKPMYICEVNASSNAFKYDAEKDLLSGEFSVFPMGQSEHRKLMLIYEKSDGTKVRKVFVPNGFRGEPLSLGHFINFYYKAENPHANADMVVAHSDNVYTYTNKFSITNVEESSTDYNWD